MLILSVVREAHPECLSALRIRRVRVDDAWIHLEPAVGPPIRLPTAWSARLLAASAAERGRWKLVGTGIGVCWPGIGEVLSVHEMRPTPGRNPADLRRHRYRRPAAFDRIAPDGRLRPPIPLLLR